MFAVIPSFWHLSLRSLYTGYIFVFFIKMESSRVKLNSEDHSKNFIRTVGELFQNKVLTDITLVCDDKVTIEAHKVVLSAGSNLFRDFLSNNTHSHPLMFLKGIKHFHLQPLIQFLYHGEATFPQNIINEIVSTAQYLEITELNDTANENQKIDESNMPFNTPKPEAHSHSEPSSQDGEEMGSTFSEKNINNGMLETLSESAMENKIMNKIVPSEQNYIPSLEAPNELSSEERPTWNGKILHNPKRSRRNNSKVWMYGGLEEYEDSTINSESIRCGLCGWTSKFIHGSTTGLKRHLKSVHMIETN